jgi:hypothetical protein
VKPRKVHRRRADEIGHEHRRRLVIDVLRRAELLDHAMVHDHDLVAHLHGFQLVMGDIDRGRAHAVVQRAQLFGHVLAELGVERAKRLVHHEGLGVAHDGPPQRNALAVAARQPADRRSRISSMPRIASRPRPPSRTCAPGMPWLISG